MLSPSLQQNSNHTSSTNPANTTTASSYRWHPGGSKFVGRDSPERGEGRGVSDRSLPSAQQLTRVAEEVLYLCDHLLGINMMLSAVGTRNS